MKKNEIVALCLLSAVIFSAAAGCAGRKLADVSDKTERPVKNEQNEKTGTVYGNRIDESGVEDVNRHTGTFRLLMPGYRGRIFIGTEGGRFFGTIVFDNWGNGTPQPLKDLRINRGKIYFVRSINSREEIVLYGGTSYFRQVFYGKFSDDGSEIRGTFRYLGAQDNWSAGREK